MTHPTDALRLVPVEPTREMIEAGMDFDERVLTLRLGRPPTVEECQIGEWKAMLAAAPASPLPGGGPTCQLCANKIEGWICQGCGSHFYENDAGALVLNTIPAAPTGDAK